MNKSELPGEQSAVDTCGRKTVKLTTTARAGAIPPFAFSPPVSFVPIGAKRRLQDRTRSPERISALFQFMIATAGSAADERSEALPSNHFWLDGKGMGEAPIKPQGCFGVPKTLLAGMVCGHTNIACGN